MNVNYAAFDAQVSLLEQLARDPGSYRVQSIQAISSADALTSSRWEWLYSPPGGLDPDFVFSELAGNIDLALIEQEIIDSALRWTAQCRRPLSINVSLTVLSDPAFSDWLVRTVRRGRVTDNQVWWEVTEAWPVVDLDVVRHTIDRMQLAGQALALDDIATLQELRRWTDRFGMPDVVKIDRKVLREPDATLTDLVKAIHARGAKVVVEGVETVPDLEKVRASGADYWQGFLAGRPIAIDDLEQGIR